MLPFTAKFPIYSDTELYEVVEIAQLTPLPREEAKPEQFTRVIRVMARLLRLQHKSLRGGRGGQVTVTNVIGLINFCQLQGY